MLRKFLLLFFTFSNAGLMFFILCLGAQNLNSRPKLSIGVSSMPPYPTGFLIGTSMTLGLISGGCTSAIFTSTKKYNF